MFEEGAAVGLLSSSVFNLRAGHLYNIVIALLVFVACVYSAWLISSQNNRSVAGRAFFGFLFALGLDWLLVALVNLLAWLGLLAQFSWLAYPAKLLPLLPLLFLAYYFSSEVFPSKTGARRTTFIFSLVALVYLIVTWRLDQAAYLTTYWGLQWQVGSMPRLILLFGLGLPLTLLAVYLVIKGILESLVEKKQLNLILCLSGLVYLVLEFVRVNATIFTWQQLLLRLVYILAVFAISVYFSAKREQDECLPPGQEIIYPKKLRFPIFLKMLFLFVSLAIVPITISFLLMFFSFKEVIDLSISKPLLWNLETSREALIISLSHIQIQALFLLFLTGLLIFIAAALASKTIAESLRGVAQGMAKVAEAKSNYLLRPKSNDEIGDVIRYFNQMATEVQSSRTLMSRWNKELETKVAARAEEVRTLYRVARAINSTLDLELLINRAINQLLPITKSDFYAVLTPLSQNRFKSSFSQGVKLGELVITPGQGLLGEALQNNEIEFSEDLSNDRRCRDEFFKQLSLTTMVVVPLRSKGKLMGLLLMGTREKHLYSEEREINLLKTVSDQLAVALENVSIYEKEKTIAGKLTELDLLKDQFISVMSHELRTPIIPIKGYLLMLLKGTLGPVTENQETIFKSMQKSVERLLALLDDLFDFSKIESGRLRLSKEKLSINDIIRSVGASSSKQIEGVGASIKLDLAAKHSNFMGDREKISEVFLSLIDNALKFRREKDELLIKISTRAEGDFVRVEVADNGIGINQEQMDKIFNKFYQAENFMIRKVGGVGLGLAIVKEIIAYHNGKIWAESAGPDQGTRIIFTLPIAEKG